MDAFWRHGHCLGAPERRDDMAFDRCERVHEVVDNARTGSRSGRADDVREKLRDEQ
jgi:hypothetical protein